MIMTLEVELLLTLFCFT